MVEWIICLRFRIKSQQLDLQDYKLFSIFPFFQLNQPFMQLVKTEQPSCRVMNWKFSNKHVLMFLLLQVWHLVQESFSLQQWINNKHDNKAFSLALVVDRSCLNLFNQDLEVMGLKTMSHHVTGNISIKVWKGQVGKIHDCNDNHILLFINKLFLSLFDICKIL